jgi:hypothetical protein
MRLNTSLHTWSAEVAALNGWLSEMDAMFVVGLYKTGTSLGVKLCISAGFKDPSGETNPKERGFGCSVERYVTHECSMLRRLNESWLRRRDIMGMVSSAERYLLAWGSPVVLKDPRFVFTLPAWIAAAWKLGFKAGVIFPRRPRNDLITAWEAAPFTRDLLSRGRLEEHIRGLLEQKVWCRQMGVPYVQISLENLRLLTGVVQY